jgi:hypothetical protein
MTGKLLEKRELANGLRLEFWDESRPVAGDRWLVKVRVVLRVPWPEEIPGEELQEVLQFLKQEVGETLHYQALQQRHFVAAKDMRKVGEELKERVLANSLAYFSHPAFPGRFVRLKALEVKEKRIVAPDYLPKLFSELKGDLT